MSVERSDADDGNRNAIFDVYPDYNAECYFDDVESPTMVTICSTENTNNLDSEWISCAVRHAVPVDTIQ